MGNARLRRALAAPGPARADAAAAGTVPAGPVDQDRSGNTRWYLQIEPGTGVIAPGTLVVIRLRHRDADPAGSGGFLGAGRPMVTVRDGDVESAPFGMEHMRGDGGYRGMIKITGTGPVDIRVDARHTTPGVLADNGPPIVLHARLDVLHSAADVAGDTTAARREQQALTSRDTTPEAVGEAFRRAAGRFALQTVETNLAEAAALQSRLTDPGQAAGFAAGTARALELDRSLQTRHDELSRLSTDALARADEAENAIPEGGGTSPDAEFAAGEAAIDAIDAQDQVSLNGETRRVLAGRSVGLGLVGNDPERRETFAAATPDQRSTILSAALTALRADCERARTAVASGRLDPLTSVSFVDRAREHLGVDSDERRAAAVDAMLQRRADERSENELGLMGASLLLLCVPGVGAYLAAALDVVVLGAEWVDVADLTAAGGAGVVDPAEAEDAAWAAAMDTIMTVVDLPGGGRATPGGRRAAPRSGRRGSRALGKRRATPAATPHDFSVGRYKQRAPGLDRHEVLSNVWLRERKLVTERLRGWVSRDNPVIRLPRKVHDTVSLYQVKLGLHDTATVARMSYRTVLNLNQEALELAASALQIPEFNQKVIKQVMDLARSHARAVLRARRRL